MCHEFCGEADGSEGPPPPVLWFGLILLFPLFFFQSMQQSNAAGRGEKLFCPASVSAFQLKLRGGDGGDNFLAPKVCSDPRHRCAPYPAVPHSRARCPFAGGRTHVEFSSAHVEFSSLCWLLPRPGAAPGAQGCWQCEGAARDTHDGLGVLLVFALSLMSGL